MAKILCSFSTLQPLFFNSRPFGTASLRVGTTNTGFRSRSVEQRWNIATSSPVQDYKTSPEQRWNIATSSPVQDYKTSPEQRWNIATFYFFNLELATLSNSRRKHTSLSVAHIVFSPRFPTRGEKHASLSVAHLAFSPRFPTREKNTPRFPSHISFSLLAFQQQTVFASVAGGLRTRNFCFDGSSRGQSLRN